MAVVLIGGGRNGRNGRRYEMREIDDFIRSLTNVKHPKLVFIGWALVPLGENQEYEFYEETKNIYAALGCEVYCLEYKHFCSNTNDSLNIINNADLVYFSGGDGRFLSEVIFKYRIKQFLKNYSMRPDKVIIGLSAGAILLGSEGLSAVDYKYYGIDRPVPVAGINAIDAVIVPHFSKEEFRRNHMWIHLSQEENNKKIALGIDDGCALVVIGNECKTICSLTEAKIHICKLKNGEPKQKNVLFNEYVDISNLYLL